MNGRASAADPLIDLVAAVRAPAQAHEVAGLDAALAAFDAAPAVALSPEEKTPMLNSVAGRLLALKVLAVAAATATAGGVAYAAANGGLEGSHGNSAAVGGESSAAPGSSEAPSSAPGGSDTSLPGSGSESSSPSSTESGSGTESESGSPSPSMKGLCTAWLAHPRDIAKVSTNPAFSVLIKNAGGADAVKGYCTTLLATAHPTHPAHPSNAQDTKTPESRPSTSHSKKPMPTEARNTKPQVAPSTSGAASSD